MSIVLFILFSLHAPSLHQFMLQLRLNELWMTFRPADVHTHHIDRKEESYGREAREEKSKPKEEEAESKTDQDTESKKSADDFEIKKKEDTVQKKRKYRSNKESDDDYDKVSYDIGRWIRRICNFVTC